MFVTKGYAHIQVTFKLVQISVSINARDDVIRHIRSIPKAYITHFVPTTIKHDAIWLIKVSISLILDILSSNPRYDAIRHIVCISSPFFKTLTSYAIPNIQGTFKPDLDTLSLQHNRGVDIVKGEISLTNNKLSSGVNKLTPPPIRVPIFKIRRIYRPICLNFFWYIFLPKPPSPPSNNPNPDQLFSNVHMEFNKACLGDGFQ